jgi:uncharacterized protein (TIGR00290 family)
MWSGGKDSALALARARRAGLAIGCLLNFVDADSRRVRFHATRAEVIEAQAVAAGVPLRQHATSWADFEASFRGALASVAADRFAGIVFGDIHLADVRAWYETRVRAAGLEHVEPLWGEPPAALLEEFVTSGGRAVITCCELAKLDEGWLGRVIDESFPAEIAGVPIDPCGENGEYHSFAFAGPPFVEPVPWVLGPIRRENGFIQADLVGARDGVAAAAAETAAAVPDLVAAAAAGRPKAWGALAANGVVTYRRRVGRAPDERTRRAVWDALWRYVEEARASALPRTSPG